MNNNNTINSSINRAKSAPSHRGDSNSNSNTSITNITQTRPLSSTTIDSKNVNPITNMTVHDTTTNDITNNDNDYVGVDNNDTVTYSAIDNSTLGKSRPISNHTGTTSTNYNNTTANNTNTSTNNHSCKFG